MTDTALYSPDPRSIDTHKNPRPITSVVWRVPCMVCGAIAEGPTKEQAQHIADCCACRDHAEGP